MGQALSPTAFPNEYFKSQDGLTRGVEVSTGLDRLKFGLYVEFGKPLLFDILAEAKKRAQETCQTIPIQLGMEDDFFYNCHATGRQGGYAFHISRADVDIFVSARKDWMDTPNVWVDIGSASCWAPGYSSIIHHVTELLKIYHGTIRKNTVSEVHICADFIGLEIETLGIEDPEKWITRAEKFNAYSDRRKFTGISLDQTEGDLGLAVETGIAIGKGDISLRIYDKVYEIKRNNSKRSLFASVWNKDEFDEQPVTRVEYQLRKNVLKQFRVKTLEELFLNINALWSYCTWDWSRYCKHTFDRENRHQDRAIIHEWWMEVHNIDWGHRTYATRKKAIAQKDKQQNIDQMIGCALNVAVIDGCKPHDIDQITTFLMGEVDTWCRKKAKKINPKTGLSELQERMKKKFNEVWPYGYHDVKGTFYQDIRM